jgi:hypothetical protein
VLKWVTGSGRIIFQGKLVPHYEHMIKDPTYGLVVFMLEPNSVDRKNIEVLLYAPWLMA